MVVISNNRLLVVGWAASSGEWLLSGVVGLLLLPRTALGVVETVESGVGRFSPKLLIGVALVIVLMGLVLNGLLVD